MSILQLSISCVQKLTFKESAMKRGFTMIELVFVIVILGILAAFSFPSFNVTRDDAQITKTIANINTAIHDIGAFYIANGKFDTVTKMTNVQFIESSTDINDTAGVDINISGGANDKCINFKVINADGNLTITNVANATGICKTIQTSLDEKDLNKTYQFGGSRIKI